MAKMFHYKASATKLMTGNLNNSIDNVAELMRDNAELRSKLKAATASKAKPQPAKKAKAKK